MFALIVIALVIILSALTIAATPALPSFGIELTLSHPALLTAWCCLGLFVLARLTLFRVSIPLVALLLFSCTILLMPMAWRSYVSALLQSGVTLIQLDVILTPLWNSITAIERFLLGHTLKNDQTGHLLIFGALSLTFLFAHRKTRQSSVLAFLLFAGFGALTEMIQALSPGRTASLSDALMNLIGTTISFSGFWLVRGVNHLRAYRVSRL